MCMFSGRIARATSGTTRALMAAMALSVLAVSQADAGGYAIREQSAEFQGTSYAGTAAGGHGISSMFWNPATITLNSGWKSEYNVSLVMPYSRAKNETSPFIPPLSPDSGNIGQASLIPVSYQAYQFNDRIWLGLGINAPFGTRTENNPLSAGALYGYTSDILDININPVAAYRINDMISVAAGLQINYMKGDLTTAQAGTLVSRIKGDDWALGFTAGVMITPMEGTRIGIGYRSRIKHELKGSFYTNLTGSNPASVKTTLPDLVTFSFRQQVNERFALMGTVEWTNWSVLKEFDIESAPFNPGPEAFNWKDGWHFAIGGEYAVNERFVVRAGYAFERSPVSDATRAVRSPDNDRHWISAGFSFAANDWLMVHGSYSHLFVKDGVFSLSAPPRPPVSGTFKQQVNIFAISATIDTGKLFGGY